MFVITADQVDSRHTSDAVDAALAQINGSSAKSLVLPAERTAGDEIQMLTADAAAALSIIIDLFRADHWSVGLGIGSVEMPLGSSTRASTGEAFYAARDAVEKAKSSQIRFAAEPGQRTDAQLVADAEALIGILLLVLERRTEGGWQIHDLLAEGLSQAQAAERVGITPGAVSLRVRTAGLKLQDAAVSALTRMLAAADSSTKEDA